MSAFDSPSPASRAICASWVVSSSRPAATRSRPRPGPRAPPPPPADGDKLPFGPRGERLSAHGAEHLARDLQLVAGLRPAPPTAQPLTVEQVCASELDANRGPSKALDRLDVQLLGRRLLGQERGRAGPD